MTFFPSQVFEGMIIRTPILIDVTIFRCPEELSLLRSRHIRLETEPLERILNSALKRRVRISRQRAKTKKFVLVSKPEEEMRINKDDDNFEGREKNCG